MSFRGFDIGPGINRYADLMAQGQKDQIELQKVYAAQQQAQADKEFNRQQMEMRNNYLYGADPETGLSPAEAARQRRTEITAEATAGNVEKRTQSTEKIAKDRLGLEATKILGGKTPETIALENENDRAVKLYEAKRKMYADVLVPRKQKAVIAEEMKALEQRIAENESIIEQLTKKGPSKAQPMYQQAPMAPQQSAAPAPKAPVSDDEIWAEYLLKHPGVANTPANRQKLFNLLNKGK